MISDSENTAAKPANHKHTRETKANQQNHKHDIKYRNTATNQSHNGNENKTTKPKITLLHKT